MADIAKNNKTVQHPVVEIFEGFSAYLGFLSELGCAGLDCSGETIETVKSWGAVRTTKNKSSSPINNSFIKCRDCSLSNQRQRIVCGEGNQKARLAIVGGVASVEDVKAVKPYSGEAGDLLNKMIAAMSLTREQVYITRAVKCCLPVNEKPKIRDVNICRSYLKKELALVKPDIICAFGEIAAMSLLETSVPLSRLRGHFHDYRGTRVMPTYSPEYLIKNTDAKRVVWEDLKKVIGELNKLEAGKQADKPEI